MPAGTLKVLRGRDVPRRPRRGAGGADDPPRPRGAPLRAAPRGLRGPALRTPPLHGGRVAQEPAHSRRADHRRHERYGGRAPGRRPRALRAPEPGGSRAGRVKVLGERRRLGPVLLELGLLESARIAGGGGSPREGDPLQRDRDRRGVLRLRGDLRELPRGRPRLPLSTGEVILEATRRVQDPDLVRGALGIPDAMLVLSSNPLLRSQSIALSPTDGFVLSRIDGATSAREVASLVSLPAEDVERSLFGLLCTGIIDFRAEAPASRVVAARPASGERAPPSVLRRPPPSLRRPRAAGRDAAHAPTSVAARRLGRGLQTGGRRDPEADRRQLRGHEAGSLRGVGDRAHRHRGGGGQGLRALRAPSPPGRLSASCAGRAQPGARSRVRPPHGCLHDPA